MAKRLNFQSANFTKDFEALLHSKRESSSDVHDAVSLIINDIRDRGDVALLALTSKFDNLNREKVSDLAVSQREIVAALNGLDRDLRTALEFAADRIRTFHEKQLPQDLVIVTKLGWN